MYVCMYVCNVSICECMYVCMGNGFFKEKKIHETVLSACAVPMYVCMYVCVCMHACEYALYVCMHACMCYASF